MNVAKFKFLHFTHKFGVEYRKVLCIELLAWNIYKVAFAKDTDTISIILAKKLSANGG